MAGAAEELFGVYITNAGGVSSFENMRRSVVKLLNDEASEKDIARLMIHAKNRTKHMYPSNDDVARFDARTEAEHILDRAISDYYQLMNIYPLREIE